MLHKGSLRTSLNRHAKGHDSSWAVSYADFLMVLLSFFIIFFSADSKNPLHQVMLDLTGKKSVEEVAFKGTGGKGDSTGNAAAGSDAKTIFTAISADLTGVKVSSSPTSDSISLDLPENIYKMGSYAAPGAELDKLIQQLKKHSDKISITIIGHSDVTAFNGSRPVIGSSNLTLSSVRAAYASIYVQKQLPEVPVSTQASSDQNRNTRSLTLIIKLRNQGGNL